MRIAVVMPDLGFSADEPLVVGCWLADEGEEVWEHQDLVEIICREAAVYVPCPADGTLVEIRVLADEPVQPGDVLGTIEARGPMSEV